MSIEKSEKYIQKDGEKSDHKNAVSEINEMDGCDIIRTKSVRELRTENLQEKSLGQVMVDVLLQKEGPQIQDIMSKNKMLKQLAQQYPMKRVGWNAETRAKTRDADGFIGHMTVFLEEMVSQLIDMGANPNAGDADGNCALQLAIQYRGSETVVWKLLNAGASPNYENFGMRDYADSDWGSMVDLAMRLGQSRIIPLLLHAGGLSTYDGLTGDLLDLTSAPPNPTPLREFAKQHNFESLAVACLQNALESALESGSFEAIRDAVSHGAPLDYEDDDGRTPLYRAVENRETNLNVIKLLLEYGADPNVIDKSGQAVAMYAIIRRDQESRRILELLLKHGLNPNLKAASHGDSNKSLVQFAESVGAKDEIIKMLKTFAAKYKHNPALVRVKNNNHSQIPTSRSTASFPNSILSNGGQQMQIDSTFSQQSKQLLDVENKIDKKTYLSPSRSGKQPTAAERIAEALSKSGAGVTMSRTSPQKRIRACLQASPVLTPKPKGTSTTAWSTPRNQSKSRGRTLRASSVDIFRSQIGLSKSTGKRVSDRY